MAVRKRGKNYIVDITIGGRRRWITAGPSKREAQALEGRLLHERRIAKTFGEQPIRPITFTSLVDKYLKASESKRSHGTEVHLLNPAKKRFGKDLIEKISAYDVETYRNGRAQTRTRNGRQRSSATCNRELAALRRVFNKAIKWNFLTHNPATLVPFLEETRGRTRFLTTAEAGRLLESSPPHLRPIIGVALGTGMRRGEILSLRWENIDFLNRVIFIRDTKSGHPRYVPLSSAVEKIIEAQPRKGDFVFCQDDGTPFHDNRTSFMGACRRAGITDFRFHDLRHTAASHMVMAGVPLKTVGDILGHRTETMTERYSHLTPGHKLEAIEKLPKFGELKA